MAAEETDTGLEEGDAVGGDDVRTVLIVDDEESVVSTYELYLETEGYEVLTANNGGEALVELSPDVDVVLLDRRMPGMSGDEVLDHVREWDAHVRVAMITAVDPGADIIEMDFDDYLTKPIAKEDLLATVEQLLLFDRYERLLSEFHAVSRKYATLKSSLEVGAEASDDLAVLADRREALREELDETIEAFADEDVADVFDDIHAAPGT